MIDDNLKWVMCFFNVVLFYFGVVNFNKHRLLKKGFHDKQIQEFVDSSIPDKNTFKKKSMFYFALCAMCFLMSFFFVLWGNSK